jgi:hypothetical protein
MAAAMAVSLLAVFGAWYFLPLNENGTGGGFLLLPALALFIAIARLAKHRFFSFEDIDGSALGAGTEQAKLLQALLQNTLEQTSLAVPVYLAALFSAPVPIRAAVPACACAFLVGRMLFFIAYRRGAVARSFGFALTFYPTAILLFWQLWEFASARIG